MLRRDSDGSQVMGEEEIEDKKEGEEEGKAEGGQGDGEVKEDEEEEECGFGKSLPTVTAAPRRRKPPGTLLPPNNKQINLKPLGSVVGEGRWKGEG